jgi:hypothetical protein
MDDKKLNPLLQEFYIYFYFIDNYIDLNNPEEPAIPFVATNIKIPSLGMLKNVIYTVKNTIIETDVGIIMEEIKNTTVYQLESAESDTLIHTRKMLN